MHCQSILDWRFERLAFSSGLSCSSGLPFCFSSFLSSLASIWVSGKTLLGKCCSQTKRCRCVAAVASFLPSFLPSFPLVFFYSLSLSLCLFFVLSLSLSLSYAFLLSFSPILCVSRETYTLVAAKDFVPGQSASKRFMSTPDMRSSEDALARNAVLLMTCLHFCTHRRVLSEIVLRMLLCSNSCPGSQA